MGQSATATILFGFQIDFEEHEEAAQRILGEEYDGEYNSLEWPDHLLKHLKNKAELGEKIEVFNEGYYDEPDYFIGVRLVRAFDYAAKAMTIDDLVVKHYDRESLTLLGKNFGLKPEIWLCPSLRE